ncbi:Putative Zinc finger, RING-type [Septoria linicola]|uniref:DSC E3 ubiquitin ligase complex subunit A n=1 Tax=Septoria linicola TaxID=215465 RepID=A0A9Q9ASH2_9PEZI|nr:putative Zinc finger, RING-type [Septoria linicola]USW49931.1 Putative Zinc finger, RING-type [Septoria linicola]
MADRRGVLLPLIFFTWIFFNQSQVNNSRSQFRTGPSIDDVVAGEQRQLWAVGNSTWSADLHREGPVSNITGLENERAYAWDALPAVRARAQEQLEYALGDWGKAALSGQASGRNPIPLYSNITGYVLGKWKRSPLQETVAIPQLNLTEYMPKDLFGNPEHARHFERNITGDHGEATIRFKQYEDTYMEDSTTEMGVNLIITDDQTYDEWEVQLHGTYDIRLGHGLFATTSDKLGGIFALPHFALSEHTFETTRTLLNKSIAHELRRQIIRESDQLNPWTSKVGDNDFVWPRCDLILYLQQMATATNMQYGSSVLRSLERELRFPTGAKVPSAPEMHFSMLIFSPDCGFILESQGPPDAFAQDGDHLVGPKVEVRFAHSRNHLLAYIPVLFSQLFLLMRQMREASTPSTRSRISFYTAVMLIIGDGYITMALIVAATSIPGLLIPLAGAGFVAFLNTALFGMTFVKYVWEVQEPERERIVRAEVEDELQREQRLLEILNRIRAERRAREQAAATTAAGPDQTPASTTVETTTNSAVPVPPQTTDQPIPGGFPERPVVQPPVDTGATPVFFMPSDQEGLLPVTEAPPPRNIDAIVASRMPTYGTVYAKTYAILVAIVFLTLFSLSWPAPIRRGFLGFLSICTSSYWIPQIVRNVQRNCRHALQWEFVLGQSMLRLVPFWYLYVYKHNVIFAEQDYYSMAILLLWIWTQVVLLGSQEIIGPRWFVKASWAPEAYDYHPILREDEEGGNMPIGFSEAAGVANDASLPASPIDERTPSLARRASIAKEAKEKGKRIFDCAICMQDLEVPVVEAGAPRDSGGIGANLLARRTYMVTPCRHIFHTGCLEGWMKFRLQCPICRETLPSL